MFSSGGVSPYNSSFAYCQDFSNWNEDKKEVEEEDFDNCEQNVNSHPLPSTPVSEAETFGQATQNKAIYSPTDEEIKEVIRGSRIEWTPEFLRLLRGGSNKEFPDCFDGTPMKVKVGFVRLPILI